jgi:hypothetical protein
MTERREISQQHDLIRHYKDTCGLASEKLILTNIATLFRMLIEQRREETSSI